MCDLTEETREKYERGKILYLQGEKSITKISKELKIHHGRFSNYLKQQGITIINKQNDRGRKSDIFETIDSEEKAYWLGFMYADGYIESEPGHRIEISLKSSDVEHLKKFSKFINNEKGKIYVDDIRCRTSFSDKKMHDDLIAKGCLPNKSLTIKFPTYDIVPKELMCHFIRGYIDGDGYLGLRADRSHGRLSITCGSEDFIKGLLKETCWEPKALEKDKRSNALSMEWGGYYVADMLKPIYEDANIYLDRKYLKFIEIKTCRSKLKPRKTWDDDGGIKRGGCKMLIRTEGVTI